MSEPTAPTTTIEVSFFGSLRHRVGCRRQPLEFDLPQVTIRSVLERLIEMQGEDFREWVINDYGWVDSRCMIFVDDEHLNSVECIDEDITGARQLKIALATPMAGG
jgi:molybdopterin converting factor small subunit